MTRVAIVDDHALVREGLRRILHNSGKIEIVGEASNAEEASALVERHAPDVLLLDISMPGKDGIQATREVVALEVGTHVLILTMHSDRHYAVRALQAGADGFILKDADTEQLLAAIAKVSRGEQYLPPELAKDLQDHDGKTAELADKRAARGLSKREFEVMCLLASGLTNREIGQRLSISVKTVDTHRAHVLKKLGLRNNADITRFAIQGGYINV